MAMPSDEIAAQKNPISGQEVYTQHPTKSTTRKRKNRYHYSFAERSTKDSKGCGHKCTNCMEHIAGLLKGGEGKNRMTSTKYFKQNFLKEFSM
jgi:hypothetical protein